MEKPCFTLQEITQQGKVWTEVFGIVAENKSILSGIISWLKEDDSSEVIFTGAGSSFFIGEIVAGFFQKNTGISSKAVSSTEIVTHPEFYINPGKRTLLVSFARSGNSPESVAAVELANQVSKQLNHLIITCNSKGAISERADIQNSNILTMPDDAHDRGLAMTSSLTSMALAALLVSRIDEIEDLEKQVKLASSYADNIIEKYSTKIQQVAQRDFKRAIFLGSGPLSGAAREGHLKLQELTDGKVICKFDSFLGFRHGPKVVVDETALVFYMFSNNKYVEQYEMDLAHSIKKYQNPIFTISVSESPLNNDVCDFPIYMNEKNSQLDEDFLPICSLVAAQLLGYYKSLQLGLNPDSPSVNGTIHRVVQGVTIYDFNKRTK